jgi:hypothetical protein
MGKAFLYKPGDRFGRWVLLGSEGLGFWRAQCDCGEVKQVRIESLTMGRSRSCGCLRREMLTSHGHAARRSGEYHSWSGMISRCNNKNDDRYEEYGGRGIRVCMRWYSFANFLADMGPRGEGLTLDRIDVDGHYEPGNCRWATAQEQANNKRNVRELNGERKTVEAWARVYGQPPARVRSRLSRGWDLLDALTTGNVQGRKGLRAKKRVGDRNLVEGGA